MKNTNSKNKHMKKLLLVSIFTLLLVIIGAVLLLERGSANTIFAHEQIIHCENGNSKQTDCCSNANYNPVHRVSTLREYTRGGYSIEDIRQMLGQQTFYQTKRVHTLYEGVRTYRIPLADYELEKKLNTTESAVPLSTDFFVRIYGEGRRLSHNIVVVLMGDGFTQAELPAFMEHAKSARDFMMNFHPFNLFRHRFVFYAAQVVSRQTWVRTPGNTTNAFGTYEIRAGEINIPLWGQQHVMNVANMAVGSQNLNMVQVIANTTRFGGVAVDFAPPINLGVQIAVTTVHTNGGGWHRTLVHEFGHSFGGLADELNGAAGSLSANMVYIGDNIIPWSHWVGHGDIGQPVLITSSDIDRARFFVPRGATTNFWGTPQSGCLMAGSHANLRYFCAVCSSELVRRMAYMTGETFQSHRPNPNQTTAPNNPHVAIQYGFTRILPYAFHGNTNLRSVTIPASVNQIGRYAFLGATNLETIIFQGNTPSRVFYNSIPFPIPHNATVAEVLHLWTLWAQITVIVPPGTVQAYINAGWVGFNVIEGGFRIENSVITAFVPPPDFNGHVVIPAGVTAINAGVFNNNPAITSVDVRGVGIENIGSNNFHYNTTITSLHFSFRNGVLLESFVGGIFTIPPSVAGMPITAIGANAFRNSSIWVIYIPSSVKYIHDWAFADSGLGFINFMGVSELQTIGAGAFSGSRLMRFTFPPNVSTIGHSTFTNTRLSSITIPALITSIGDFAFSHNSYLTSVTFSQNSQLHTIGAFAFSNTAIINITIPASVITIGNNAFSSISALRHVYFEEDSNLTTIDHSAFNSDGLVYITIPSSVTSIGVLFVSVFAPNLQVTWNFNPNLLGNSLVRLGMVVTRVIIPYDVSTIAENQFFNFARLHTVTLLRPFAGNTVGTALADINAFMWINPANITIYVPCWDSVAAYSQALNWFTLIELGATITATAPLQPQPPPDEYGWLWVFDMELYTTYHLRYVGTSIQLRIELRRESGWTEYIWVYLNAGESQEVFLSCWCCLPFFYIEFDGSYLGVTVHNGSWMFSSYYVTVYRWVGSSPPPVWGTWNE